MTLLEAYEEMIRRADVLSAGNRVSAGADMPVITTQVGSGELRRDPAIVDKAEGIAQLGRKTNVHLDIYVPGGVAFLEHFGGSQLLAAAARPGSTVRLVSER